MPNPMIETPNDMLAAPMYTSVVLLVVVVVDSLLPPVDDVIITGRVMELEVPSESVAEMLRRLRPEPLGVPDMVPFAPSNVSPKSSPKTVNVPETAVTVPA